MARKPKPSLVPVEELTEEEKTNLLSEKASDLSMGCLGCFTGGFDYNGEPINLQWTDGRRSLNAILVMGQLTKGLYMGQLRDYNTMVMYCAENPRFRLDTPKMEDYACKIALGGFIYVIRMNISYHRENFWIFAYKENAEERGAFLCAV